MMNNQNQMNQMNQMCQMYQMNQMNQMNLMNPMNPMNQMNLVNPMNQMNLMNQMNPMNPTIQMMQQNMNNQNNNNGNQIQNEPIEMDINFILLYGINDPIKKLKFRNVSNNDIYKATISKYFTKRELYWLIGQYEKNNFILIYKDNILEKDESNIDDIPDGDTIDIYNKTKEGYHIKHPYYNYLLEKYPNSPIKNVIFSYNNGKKFIIFFPSDTSIAQMIKVLKFEFKFKILIFCAMAKN